MTCGSACFWTLTCHTELEGSSSYGWSQRNQTSLHVQDNLLHSLLYSERKEWFNININVSIWSSVCKCFLQTLDGIIGRWLLTYPWLVISLLCILKSLHSCSVMTPELVLLRSFGINCCQTSLCYIIEEAWRLCKGPYRVSPDCIVCSVFFTLDVSLSYLCSWRQRALLLSGSATHISEFIE